MISKDIYFMVEVVDALDGRFSQVLCKDEDLADFVKNYDQDKYKITNVYGINNMFLDKNEFIKSTEGLEQGEKS